MKFKVAVLGATGVLGRNTLPRLLETGHEVRAVVRTDEQARHLAGLGLKAVLGDTLIEESLTGALAGCDAALHLATAIPKAGRGQDWSRNDRIRREGTRNLLAACKNNHVSRYLQQSITLLYGECGDRLVDETAALQPSANTHSAADMEALVQASNLEWCILRDGLFYCPGTGREEDWQRAAQQGSLRWSRNGEGFRSLIHVADMAQALVRALETAAAGSIYNVVDDLPVWEADLIRYVAAASGAG